jgi:O-antigen/teichoic acid export membrane protein
MTTRSKSRLNRWASILGITSLLAGGASLLNLIANILISRALPTEEVGAYALLIAIVQLIMLLGSLGQPTLIKRHYSARPQGTFNWKADFRITMRFTLPVLCIISIIVVLLYRLDFQRGTFVVLGGALLVAIVSLVDVFNSQRLYTWASLILRLPTTCVIIPAILGALFPRYARLDLLLITVLSAAALTLIIGWRVLSAKISSGTERVPLSVRGQGLNFTVLAATTLLPSQGLISIAGLIAPEMALAAYGALAVLTRPFFLIRELLSQIMFVEVSRDQNLKHTRIILGLCSSIFFFAIGAIILLPPFASFVYNWRYIEYHDLITPLTIIASLLVTEIFPRSYMSARAAKRTLQRYTTADGLIAISGLILVLGLGLWLGIRGIAWAGVVLMVLRNLSAYAIYAYVRFRSHRPAT